MYILSTDISKSGVCCLYLIQSEHSKSEGSNRSLVIVLRETLELPALVVTGSGKREREHSKEEEDKEGGREKKGAQISMRLVTYLLGALSPLQTAIQADW